MKKIILISTLILSSLNFIIGAEKINADTSLIAALKWSPKNTFKDNIQEIIIYFDSLNTKTYKQQDKITDLFYNYINTLNIDVNNISETSIFLSDAFLLQTASTLNEESIFYFSFSTIMLERFKNDLETEISNNFLKIPTREQNLLIGLLIQNNMIVDVVPSNIYKAWGYLKEGRIQYIIKKSLTTHFNEFIKIILSMMLILLIVIFLINKVKNLKNNNLMKKKSKIQLSKIYISIKNYLMLFGLVVIISTCGLSQKSANIKNVKQTISRIVKIKKQIEKTLYINDSLLTIKNDSLLLSKSIDLNCKYENSKASLFDLMHQINNTKDHIKTKLNQIQIKLQKEHSLLNGIYTEAKKINKRLQSLTEKQQQKNEESNNSYAIINSIDTLDHFINDKTQNKEVDSLQNIFNTELIKCKKIISKNQKTYDRINFLNNNIDYYIYKPNGNSKLSIFYDKKNGEPIYKFKSIADYLNYNGKTPKMLMNGGMFNPDYSPVGLLVTNGKLKRELNISNGKGNFFLKPNGVFIIDTLGKGEICTTGKFLNYNITKIKHATQSGPMLVIDNKIHPIFKQDSKHKNIRNGVGIMDNGDIVFIISNKPIRLYDFAIIFRDLFGCKNALYLDGAISDMFVNIKGRDTINQMHFFGPMIAVYENTLEQVPLHKKN